MTAALLPLNSARRSLVFHFGEGSGTSCWKKLMIPGSCSMAISV